MFYFRIATATIELLLLGTIAAVLLDALKAPRFQPSSFARAAAGDVMLYVAAFVFLASGVSKLLGVPLAVTEMTLLGLTGTKYLLVAALEIFSGLLLLVKPIRPLAVLFASAHLGGAICAHLIADQYFAILPSAIVLSLCWLGAFLRHPELLASLRERAEAGAYDAEGTPLARLPERAG